MGHAEEFDVFWSLIPLLGFSTFIGWFSIIFDSTIITGQWRPICSPARYNTDLNTSDLIWGL